jgi:hypothetical protein
MVYQMMSADIQRINPVDFFDLLKKQIGVWDTYKHINYLNR